MEKTIVIENQNIYLLNLSEAETKIVISKVPLDEGKKLSEIIIEDSMLKFELKIQEIISVPYNGEFVSVFSLDEISMMHSKKINNRCILFVDKNYINITCTYPVGKEINYLDIDEDDIECSLKLIKFINVPDNIKKSELLKYIETIFNDKTQLCVCQHKHSSSRTEIRGLAIHKNIIASIRCYESFIQAYDFVESEFKIYPIGDEKDDTMDIAFSNDGNTFFITTGYCGYISMYKFSNEEMDHINNNDLSQENYSSIGISNMMDGNLVSVTRTQNFEETNDKTKWKLKCNLEIFDSDGNITTIKKVHNGPEYVVEIKSGPYKGCLAVTHKDPFSCICIYNLEIDEEILKIKNKDFIKAPKGIIWVDKYQSLLFVDSELMHIGRIKLAEHEIPCLSIVPTNVEIEIPHYICCDEKETILFVSDSSLGGVVHSFEMLN